MHAVIDHVKGIEDHVPGERWRVRQDVHMPPPAPRERAAAAIRADILNGAFEPGEFLPGQRELAARYGVAYNTVGDALKVLVAEELVEVIPRKGSRVLPSTSTVEVQWRTDGHVAPIGADTLGAGVDLKVEAGHALKDIALALHGEVGMDILLRRSVLQHDGMSWAMRELYFPTSVVDLAPPLASADYVDEAQVLSEHGMRETGQLSHWYARPAMAEEAQLLRSGSSPVHAVRRVSFCEDTPVCCELLVIRADKVRLAQSSGRLPSALKTR